MDSSPGLGEALGAEEPKPKKEAILDHMSDFLRRMAAKRSRVR
jgi:hypothetical protein